MVRGAITKENVYFYLPPLVCAGAFLAFYAFLHLALYRQGILHTDLALFGEKALLIWRGLPPRFENFGFVYPPLPILIAGLANGNLVLAQAAVAALISTVLVFHVWKATPSPKEAFPLILYIVFSFPVLFLATQRFDLYLYFFIVVLSAKFLYQHKKKERSLDLFLAGPLLGLAFFVHFSALYLAPMFFILIGLLYRDQPKMILPVALTFFTPFGVAFFTFAYVNLLFTGEAFGFLSPPPPFSSMAMEAAAASGNWAEGLIYTLKQVVLLLPVIFPYFIGFRHHRTPLLLLPFMVLLALVYAHVFSPAVYFLAIFMIYFLLMTEWREPVQPVALWLLLCVSLVASPAAAFFSTEPNERNVVHAFLETGEAGRNLEPFQNVVRQLEPKKGKILLDDANGYPVIYLMNRPDRFILPYQYEFAVALSNPADFADHAVAWKNKQGDLVLEAFKNPVKSFRKRFENESVIIWERIT